MQRVRIILPKNQSASYVYLDILHDAIVNAWVAAGAGAEEVVGPTARLWHFGALGWRGKNVNYVHTLVVGTPDKQLAKILSCIRTEEIKHVRAFTGEAVDFSAANIEDDPAPVVSRQRHMGVLMLSPLAVSIPASSRNGRKWHRFLTDFDAGEAISARLSRIAHRKVQINIWPDSLYLRIHPRHDVLVRLKKLANGKEAFVIGMKSPLVIEANEKDLELAWYAGIGEKNRSGFGCIGAVEKGVGR
jgi:CRISPR-associated endoribonuclease Cas6